MFFFRIRINKRKNWHGERRGLVEEKIRMHDLFGKATLTMKIGILLAVLTILFGFSIGIMFGESEAKVQNKLKAKAEKVIDSVYKGDADLVNRSVRGAMNYFKRAHIHGNGLGVAALVLITALFLFCPTNFLRDVTALLLGIGALGYSSYWMIAGKMAPRLGGISQAREAVGWYATFSAFLCVAGVVLTLIVFISAAFMGKEKV